MKRSVAAAIIMLAAVSWFPGATGTGEAEAQVLWPEPPPPPQFGGSLIGRSEGGGSTALPIVDEQINVDIDGQHATTRLRQTFYNRSGDRIEGQYTLRVAPGVRANGFAYWNGEQKIVGEVFERDTARQVYRNVTSRRRDPGLLEETGDGVFSFVVFPIEPNERKRVEVSYGQWLPRRASTIEMHAPVTRKDSEIAVTIWDGRELREIASPTHQLDVQRLSNGRYLVRARRALADTTELVLRYHVVDKPWTVSGYIHRDKEQDAYFTLALAAPELPASATLAKDVTLVIDRSGSMMGEPIRQARAACIDIVKRLRSDDRVNILLFDHTVEKLYPEPRAVTEAIRKQAIEYLEMMDEGGATDLAMALEQALAAQGSGNRPRVVLFFTDGQSDVPPVLAAAQADRRDVRVFTVGFGPQVNRPLLARLAARKRGRFTYISAAANIERDVSLLYRQIDAPVLVDVSLETSAGATSRLYPPTMPDLFVDDELRVTGTAARVGAGHVHDQGQAGRPPVRARDQVRRQRRDQAALGRAAVGGRARRGSRRRDLAGRFAAGDRERGDRSGARLQLHHALHRVPGDPGERARRDVGQPARQRARVQGGDPEAQARRGPRRGRRRSLPPRRSRATARLPHPRRLPRPQSPCMTSRTTTRARRRTSSSRATTGRWPTTTSRTRSVRGRGRSATSRNPSLAGVRRAGSPAAASAARSAATGAPRSPRSCSRR